MPGLKDLTGLKFGKMLVQKRDIEKKTQAAYWICRCECGNIKSVRGQRLRNGEVIDCGCGSQERNRKKIDTTSLLNQRFGKLIVLERDLSKKIGHGESAYWVCQCDCGNITSISSNSLLNDKVKSCGCLIKETLAKRNTQNLTGLFFGKIQAISSTNKLHTDGSFLWNCLCECGNECQLSVIQLHNNKFPSCPFCNIKSSGEAKITQILRNNNINYIKEYAFSDLRNDKTNALLRYDFAILNDKNEIQLLIEFDGEQHYHQNTYFKEKLEDIQYRDNLKNEYAKSHNIPLKRISYKDYNNITLEMIMEE